MVSQTTLKKQPPRETSKDDENRKRSPVSRTQLTIENWETNTGCSYGSKQSRTKKTKQSKKEVYLPSAVVFASAMFGVDAFEFFLKLYATISNLYSL